MLFVTMSKLNDLKADSMRSGKADAANLNKPQERKRLKVTLWTVQGLLAATFLFAGGIKLALPVEALAQQSHLPGLFMKFIGTVEVLGALGLILPGITRIRTGLTPLAASGLAFIMVGATVITLAGPAAATASIPAVVGALSVFVAYWRFRLASHSEPSAARVLQPAR
jgi:FtsH-binding integral membrane protein